LPPRTAAESGPAQTEKVAAPPVAAGEPKASSLVNAASKTPFCPVGVLRVPHDSGVPATGALGVGSVLPIDKQRIPYSVAARLCGDPEKMSWMCLNGNGDGCLSIFGPNLRLSFELGLFPLVGSPPKGPPVPRSDGIRFVAASDLHGNLERLGNLLDDMQRRGIETLVLVGDTCNGKQEDYDAIKAYLEKRVLPENVFYVVGNHEEYGNAFKKGYPDGVDEGFPNGETTKAVKERFNRFRGAPADGPVYHEAEVDGYHFIFLGGEKSRMDDWSMGDAAYLSKEQLAWLEEELKAGADPSKPVFVFLHQPFSGTVSGSGERGRENFIKQEEELKAILARYPQVVFFSGHTHWELDMPTTHYTDETFRYSMLNTGSLSDPYNKDDQRIDRPMSEGLEVEFGDVDRDGDFEVVVQGRDYLGHRFIPGRRYEIPVPTKVATGK
jgi:predicted phosphodiesterase